MVETDEQLERARRALERRSPQELAAFVLSLIGTPNGVGSYARAFAMADSWNAAAEIVESEIENLREGEREYDRRHRRGSVVTSRLGHLLDAIELALLPRNPAAAVEMLARLIESDAEISDHCFEDDFGAQAAFGRACDLFRAAARNLPVATVQPILDRLRSRDDFALRIQLGVNP